MCNQNKLKMKKYSSIKMQIAISKCSQMLATTKKTRRRLSKFQSNAKSLTLKVSTTLRKINSSLNCTKISTMMYLKIVKKLKKLRRIKKMASMIVKTDTVLMPKKMLRMTTANKSRKSLLSRATNLCRMMKIVMMIK